MNTFGVKMEYKNMRYSLDEVKLAVSRLLNSEPSPQDALRHNLSPSPDFVTKIRMLAAQQPHAFRQPVPLSQIELDRMVTRIFEEDLWNAFDLKGVLVPDDLLKECQKRLREGQSRFDPITLHSDIYLRTSLEVLNSIHHERKRSSVFHTPTYRNGDWMTLKSIHPSEEMRSHGSRFWALIIGNDKYTSRPLSGCVNDAYLMKNHIIEYLGVPDDHIHLLQNATRQTMIDSLYDLRDSGNIRRGDNILIHFSGHGTSYRASQHFSELVASAGSIEGICPVDRGPSVPDISDRELNSILFEVQAEKGQNITVILDCCRSGGALRGPQPGHNDATRYLLPLRTDENELDLQSMLNIGDNNPRRGRSYTPPISSESWAGDIGGFVQLASCQDFEVAKEAEFHASNDPNHPTARGNVASNSTLQGLELSSEDVSFSPRGPMKPSVSGSKPPKKPMQPKSPPRYGCFTWALVNVLKSEKGRFGTYESVVASIGKLSDSQEPVVVGHRKSSRLWYREEI